MNVAWHDRADVQENAVKTIVGKPDVVQAEPPAFDAVPPIVLPVTVKLLPDVVLLMKIGRTAAWTPVRTAV